MCRQYKLHWYMTKASKRVMTPFRRPLVVRSVGATCRPAELGVAAFKHAGVIRRTTRVGRGLVSLWFSFYGTIPGEHAGPDGASFSP